MVDIAKKVKELRSFTKLSQEKFAEKIELSRSTLALIEVGKSVPTYEAIYKMCDQYKVLPAYFFDEKESDISTFLGTDKFEDEYTKRNEDIYDTYTYRKKYGGLVIENLKKELYKTDQDALELYMALIELPELILMLKSFSAILRIDSPEKFIPSTLDIQDLNNKKSSSYDIYRNNITQFLTSIKEYQGDIISFRNQLIMFLKRMKEIDSDNEIWYNFD